MKIVSKVVVSLCAVLIALSTTIAAVPLGEKVTLDGALRYRSELNGKDFSNQTGMDEYSSLRTHLGIKVQASTDVFVYVNFQDARLLGTQGTNKPATSSFFASEAYFEAAKIPHLNFGFKAGRYHIRYGRYRIVGTGNFNLYGPRTYDAVGFLGKIGDMKWDINYAKTSSTTDPAEDGNRDLSLLFARGSLADGTIQPYLWILYDQRVLDPVGLPSDPAYIPGQKHPDLWITPAFYAKQYVGDLQFILDAAGQFGKYQDRDLSAWLLAFDTYYSFAGSIKPKLGAGIDFSSGSVASDLNNGKDHTFRSPYMSRHGFRGYMDFFKDVDPGLFEYLFYIRAEPVKSLKLAINVHHFTYQHTQPSAKDATKTFSQLGQEVDTRLRFPVSDGLKVDAAYCVFHPTEDYKPSGDLAHYAYLALTASF